MNKNESEPLLTREHWRQTALTAAATIVPILLAAIPGLWILSGAVNSTRQLTELHQIAIVDLRQRLGDLNQRSIANDAALEHRMTILETQAISEDQQTKALITQIDNLHASVNNLTIAVTRLTDLLPEKSRQ